MITTVEEHYNSGLHYMWNINATEDASRANRPFSWWPRASAKIRPPYYPSLPPTGRPSLGGHTQ